MRVREVGDMANPHDFGGSQDDTAVIGAVATKGAIQGELVAVHAQLDRLEHQFSLLQGKLEPILDMRPRAEDSTAQLSDVTGSAITLDIRKAQERIAGLVVLVTEMLDRVEL